MKRVSRYDAGQLAKPERTTEGWLRAEAHTARVGILEYTKEDGGVRRELVTPEELFDAESIASARMVPLTNTHPSALLDASTARGHQIGSVGENVRPDGDLLAAPIMVTDGDTVAAIMNGVTGMSWGYDCALDETPGVDPKFGPFDARQVRRRYNHLAVVQYPRAGDGARIRLDAAGNAVLARAKPPVYVALQQANAATQQPEKPMPQTVRIDSATFPLDDANAPAIQAAIAAALDKARTDGVTLVSAERAKFDAAERGRADVVAKFDKATTNVKKWAARIKARLDAMKARMVPCEECGGTGKVAATDDSMAKCDYCDGAGSFRMHDAVKAMPTPDGEPAPDDDMEAMGDDLSGEPAAEEATEKAANPEHKDAAKRRADARKIAQQKRRDSLARIADRRAKTRAALLTAAGKHLDSAEIADKSDLDIKRAVVGKLAPHLDAAVVAKMDAGAIGVLYDAETKRADAGGTSPSVLLTQGTHPAPRADAARAAALQKKIDAAEHAMYHSHEPVKA